MKRQSILSSALNLPGGTVLLQGHLLKNKGIEEKQRLLDTYGLVYIYAGNGRYMDESGYSRRVNPGSLILLFPGLAHHYQGSPHWSEVFFLLKGPGLISLEEAGLFDRATPVLDFAQVDFWRDRLLAALPETPPRSKSSVARNYYNVVRLLLEMIDDKFTGNESDQNSKWLQRARRAIQQSIGSHEGLKAIAASLGEPSTEAFRKRFSRLHGSSVSQYRYQLQIEQTSHLLQSTDSGLKEIADQLGFHDAFHLSKRFKAATGMSPRQFRHLYAGAR